jgi:hypothetical protein
MEVKSSAIWPRLVPLPQIPYRRPFEISAGENRDAQIIGPPVSMTPRGHPDSCRLAFPPNYSKALPPNPPVYPYLKRSSSVYSQGTELCRLQPLIPIPVDFATRPIIDESIQPSAPSLIPRHSHKKLSTTRLPQGNSIETIQTQRPLSKPIQQPLLLGPSSSTYRVSPPSPSEVEMSSPTRARRYRVYSGFWLDNILPAPIGPRLLEPFDPQVLCKQNDSVREARAYGEYNTRTRTGLKYGIPPRRSTPGIVGNTDEDTAVALSLVYQHYLTDDFEGEPGGLQKQTEDTSSRVKAEKELHPQNLDGRPGIETSQRLPRPTLLERVPIAESAHFTHLSRITSQKQRPSLRAKTLDPKEGTVPTEPQQPSTPLQTPYGKRPKVMPRSGPSMHHYSSLTMERKDPTSPGGLPERPRSTVYTFPVHVEDAAAQRHASGRVTERAQLHKAHVMADDAARRSTRGSESPVLALEGQTPYAARALSDNRARAWLDLEHSNASAPDFLSVERRPVTVPRESNSRYGVLPLQAELDHMLCRGGVCKSRFSVDSLYKPRVGALQQPPTSFSRSALPSFLTRILPYKGPNLQGRREGRQCPKFMPVDISPDPKRGGREPNTLKDIEVGNWL